MNQPEPVDELAIEFSSTGSGRHGRYLYRENHHQDSQQDRQGLD